MAAPQPVTLPEDSRLPMPGTVLVREYKGCSIEVRVLEQGFENAGQTFRSLSAVAKAVTGTHINGFLFFKLLSVKTFSATSRGKAGESSRICTMTAVSPAATWIARHSSRCSPEEFD